MTLVGLWVVPSAICIALGFARFLCVQGVYLLATVYYAYRLFFLPPARDLPRELFRWLSGVFKASVAIGAAGYVLLITGVVATGSSGGPPGFVLGLGAVLCWYGLYFGIMTRDIAELLGERVALTFGGRRNLGAKASDCGICGQPLAEGGVVLGAVEGAGGGAGAGGAAGTGAGLVRLDHHHRTKDDAPMGFGASAPAGRPPSLMAGAGAGPPGAAGSSPSSAAASPSASSTSPTIRLPCRHCFHADCIRGWTIIGKKDTCPLCREKVDLRALFAQRPWETSNITWTQMLDTVRFSVVWTPAILLAIHVLIHGTGLDRGMDLDAAAADAATDPGAPGTPFAPPIVA